MDHQDCNPPETWKEDRDTQDVKLKHGVHTDRRKETNAQREEKNKINLHTCELFFFPLKHNSNSASSVTRHKDCDLSGD